MKSQILPALKVWLFLTLITGILYPLTVTLISQIAFSEKANGSLIFKNGKPMGSEWIGQSFRTDTYFWGRPSAADSNPLPSGGTNLGFTNQVLQEKISKRMQQGLTADLLFASGSGLDPHLSVDSTLSQVDRVVKARQNISKESIVALIYQTVEPRDFGFLGEERVNILKLNLALDSLKAAK